ncbi:GTP cyclohydrolase II RibA [Pseudomonas syringae]|uniref:GTP cyclohydrolase II RibA n=1 Tax=Pseudomonas syringae TaxID=317 RepID=UPI000E3262FA|nr:GTP cyclohydrolase II RibA [Pseudomonas syringae]
MNTTIVLPTIYGDLMVSYMPYDGQQAVLIRTKELSDIPFLRIHSSCVFSEAFHACDCDCALQLNASLDYINKNNGLVIYLYQEGRGIGLEAKIQAIALQHLEKINTAEAFKKLGFDPDPRTYKAATTILKSLEIKKVILATSNPLKISAVEAAGIEISQRIVLEIPESDKVNNYKNEKKEALSHL